MRFIIEILISGLIVLIGSYITPGVFVESFWIAILVGVVIGVLNASLGFILRVLTLPLNILTFGFIGFLISGFVIYLADVIIPGFETGGLLSILLFAIVLGVLKILFSIGLKK